MVRLAEPVEPVVRLAEPVVRLAEPVELVVWPEQAVRRVALAALPVALVARQAVPAEQPEEPEATNPKCSTIWFSP